MRKTSLALYSSNFKSWFELFSMSKLARSESFGLIHFYSVFRGFGQTYLGYGGLVLSSSQFQVMTELLQKTIACGKSVQK